MKGLPLLFLVLMAAPEMVLARQLSADEALRTVGRERGEPWMERLLVAVGTEGSPQPAQWALSFQDAAARGGVREFVVSSRGVTAESTPVVPSGVKPGSVLSVKNIKVDSTGAFATANREAARARLGFDSLNYRLRDRNGTPVWRVALFDRGGVEVGWLDVSARDASVVTPLSQPSRPGAEPAGPADITIQGDRSLSDRWVEGGGLSGHLGRWGERTWDATKETSQRAGDSISKFFTGRPMGPHPAGN